MLLKEPTFQDMLCYNIVKNIQESFMTGKMKVASPSPWAEHDHAGCIEEALRLAEEVCIARGVRLTELRRKVLRLIWGGHKPIGAYALLEQLQPGGGGAPPTVYRTLDFLLEHGLIHRLASLNAFIGCRHPAKPHSGQFLICESCHNLTELADEEIDRAIARGSRGSDFTPSRQTVEVLGLCPLCRNEQENRI
jgi:Fur family transcriptional regulator, zinc uptake regulator